MNNNIEKENILVTVALPYVNGLPHVGHVVGSHLPADIYHRYNIAAGNNCYMIGGMDSHGTPAVIDAKRLNMELPDFVTKMKNLHSAIYKKLNISYDIFSTTHTPTHFNETQEFFNLLNANGYISTGSTKRLYCENCKMFLADRFVEGTCPYCGKDANGDECEHCCHTITTDILKNPRCKTCGSTPVLKENTEVFFDLPKLQKDLNKFVESKRNIWRPTVYSEAKRLINEGFNKRSISRDIGWGIPINLKGFEDKVFYIWFEAPIGYLSITKELSTLLGKDLYNEFWIEKNNNKIIHFVGKDNIQFHGTFFPAMILGSKKFNNAYNLAGNCFANYEGQKISKSKRVGVFCGSLLDPNCTVDIDVLRAYLTTIIPEKKDTEFTWADFKQNTNAELANKLGNFFNRTINMVNSYLGGKIECEFGEPQNEIEKTAFDALNTLPNEICESYKNIEIKDAYKKIMQLASAGNTLIEQSAPWAKFKEGDIESVKRTLYLAINIARAVTILFAPICPTKMTEFYNNQLKLSGSPLESGILNTLSDRINNITVGSPTPLFPRWDDKTLEQVKTELLNFKDVEDLI